MVRSILIAALGCVLCACATTDSAVEYGTPPSLLTLTPEQQLDIYRNIESTYAVRVVKRGSKVRKLALAPKQIAPRISWRDRTYDDVAGFMQDARITGLLVLKDGQIVLERYAFDRKPSQRWTSFSVAKSVTALLVGAAIQDGYIKSLNDPVTTHIPDLKGSAYEGVTVRHLISMTSGVKWNEDYTDVNSDVAQASSWQGEPGMNPLVSYMRRLPREAEPGTKFVYKTGETDMAGILVANATRRGLAEYLSEKVWKPYGMEQDAIWMVDRGGMERGGCCVSMTLRDYARVGLFTLEGGKVGARQVIPESYIREATSDQIKPPVEGDYGYFWWIRGNDGYAAQGIFGQQIRIVPDENLVIVINAAFPKATDKELSAAQNAVLAGVRAALK